jgi:hypothetical protein
VNASANSIGLDAIVESIPFSFSANSTTSQQKLTEFCKVGASQFDSWNSGGIATSTVVTDALSNFNNCVQLANSGLQLTVSMNQPDTLVVSGVASAAYSGEISSVAYDDQLMSCNSADFNLRHDPKTLHGPVHLKTSPPFSITCTKKPQRSLDQKSSYYPRTTLTIAAGAVNPLAIVFPSDTLYGYELASQARLAVSTATQKMNDAESSATTQKQRADTLQDSVNSLKNRLNGVSVSVVTHELGSGTAWGCGPYGSDWSRGLREEAQRVCGGNNFVLGSNNVRGGGACGYGSIGFACIIVPQ